MSLELGITLMTVFAAAVIYALGYAVGASAASRSAQGREDYRIKRVLERYSQDLAALRSDRARYRDNCVESDRELAALKSERRREIEVRR